MPVTSLAKQLKRLEAPQTQTLVHQKVRSSFLFDSKEAARLDRDTVYEIGLNGLQELKELNPIFSSFENTLFDVSSRAFQRAVETADANEKLNHQIKTFLTLLSPYFLVKSSHKALEWLINRYQINEYNVDYLMALILPYHETMLFSRMLQIIPLKENTGDWHWLYHVKKEGVPLSKTALLTRASKDMAFLKFVANMPDEAIKVNGGKAHSLGTLYAFYCTTLIGALEYADPINELHITHLLPSIMAGLSSTIPDFTASAFMIIARLSTKACLGEKILTGLFNKISKVEHKKLRSDTSLILVLLCQNVLKKINFPDKAVKRLAETKWFIPSLANLSQQKILVTPLVLYLLRTSIKMIIDGDNNFKEFVQNLLSSITLDNSDAQEIFTCLLDEFKNESSEDIICWYSGLFRDLEKSFPKVFDITASRALSSKKSKEAKAVETLLGVNISRNDLYERLVNPNPHVRVCAITQIVDNFNPDQLGWLKQSLLERFKDESPAVVKKLLKMPEEILLALPQHTLFDRLVDVIVKFNYRKSILKRVIPMLLDRADEENIAQIILLILPHILKILTEKMFENTKFSPVCKWFIKLNGNEKIVKLFEKNEEESEEETNDEDSSESLKSSKEIQRDIMIAVWSSLNDKENLPTSEQCFAAFESNPVFKEHSRYWFAMSLMLAGSIPDHPDQNLVKLVMSFLLEYLQYSKVCAVKDGELTSEKNLRKMLIESNGNTLPVNGALYCLTVLTSKTLHSKRIAQNYWFDFNNKENSFTLFVYKVIHEGLLANKKGIRKAFSKTQTEFLKNHFPSVEVQINFLCNALIYDSSLGVKCLQLIKEIISETPDSLSQYLKENSILIPALTILLHSKEETIRMEVLSILDIFKGSLTTEFYRGFVDELADFATEMKIDPEQIVIFAYSHLTPLKKGEALLSHSKQEAMSRILKKLVHTVTAAHTPFYIKDQLLQILEFVQSQEIFYELQPMAINLLGKTKPLTPYESNVLFATLKRFNSEMAKCLSEEKTWEFLNKGLADQSTQVMDNESNKTICPAAILLNQITKDLFDSIPEPKMENQEKLLSLIISHITDGDNAQVASASASLFKRITIDCQILVSLLTPMIAVEAPTSAEKLGLRPRQRKRNSMAPSLEILETLEWKKGVCLLELTQNKKKLSSLQLFLPVLFNILKKCLRFEEQGPVEYCKQLLLSSILHCCERLAQTNDKILSPETLQVDLVVDCLRVSHNPQTHHHALLALTYIANVIPDQVLHNIMAIFTFIGSSVVRQDDAYSFHIITKVVDTIIPILIKTETQSVLELSASNVIRVFVAALLDVPEHRRLPLIHKLITTLDNGKYLWLFLLLVFESHVVSPVVPSIELVKFGALENNAIPKKLETALQLCSEFQPSVILQTCLKLLVHLSAIPHDKDDKNAAKIEDKLILSIFNVNDNTAKQLRHYKYTIIMFLSSLLSSHTFVQQVAELSEEDNNNLEPIFESLIEQNLVYLRAVLKQVEVSSQLPTAKYWKAILNQTYDVLDKLNALLPTDMFLRVVKSLMKNEVEAVTRKAMELLGWRLQQPRPVPVETLIGLLKPLKARLSTISPTEETSQEVQLTQQTALFAMKLMARHLAGIYKDEFKSVLVIASELVSSECPLNWPILGSLVLCIGELTLTLAAHSLSQLPVFMPALIKLLKTYSKLEGGDLLLLSIVTAIQKIVDCLVLFISPYLDQLLMEISLLSARYENDQSESQKSTLVQKLKLIRQKISSDAPNRVLVPAITSCFSKLIKHEKFVGAGPLLSILSESIHSAADLTVEITNFFLTSLQFRSNMVDLPLDKIESVEGPVISALTVLVLKLPESAFRSFYSKIYDWAVRNTDRKERAITFYRLSFKIAESLKSLFILFAGIFVANCSELLASTVESNEEYELLFEGEFKTEKTCLLIDSILNTLLTIFTYDSHNFITKERFNNLMQPLVDQLENEVGGEELWKVRCETLLTPCIAQMSTATSDDSLWKQLNYQVLLKTRHEKAHVRLAAVRTVCALAGKLGEDFLPLLPETVPFLAELLEDDEEDVEHECQKVVNEMEEILGEPIQKYF